MLQKVRAELLDWQHLGMSVMEISHRSDEYIAINQQAAKDLQDLLDIPENYRVLFLPGGATAQFAIIPMNLLRGKRQADYIHTGIWSQQALTEARQYCQVNIAASSEASSFTTIPPLKEWRLDPAAAYVHYTDNETVGGIEFPWIPEVGDIPLVADMSSNILSRPFNVAKFGLIYASAQKNIGPAGLSVIIVREDLLGQALAQTPSVFNYHLQAINHSIYNTPPVFSVYLAGLMFEWVKQQGGVAAIAAINQRKAEKLYQCIDRDGFYKNSVQKTCRSRINVPFTLPAIELENKFLQEAALAGLVNLKGHRLAGGIRASIYNAMPEQGVDALVAFMNDFAARSG